MTYVAVYKTTQNSILTKELELQKDIIHDMYADANQKNNILKSHISDYSELLYLFPLVSDALIERNIAFTEFVGYADRYGIPTDCFGKKFKSPNNETYRFIGVAPENTKYKCLIQSVASGITKKATIDYILKFLVNTQERI